MFKDMIDKQVIELKKLWANKRQLTFQLLNLAMIVFSALMIWKGLMFVTKVIYIISFLISPTCHDVSFFIFHHIHNNTNFSKIYTTPTKYTAVVRANLQ